MQRILVKQEVLFEVSVEKEKDNFRYNCNIWASTYPLSYSHGRS